jgi:hypothetical protein
MDPRPVVKLLGDTTVVFLGTNDWSNGTAEPAFKMQYLFATRECSKTASGPFVAKPFVYARPRA